MLKRLLKLRREKKRKKPKFLRQETWKKKSFKKNPKWRKPRGKSSKMRVRERGKPRSPKIGYSSPKIVRGFHPCGKPEILVHNVSDLENSEEKVYRIASSVGTRKKIEILHHAIEKNIKILNPSIKFLKVSSVEDLEKNSKIITYVKDVLISEKVSDDVREEILKKAQEMGIEVE